MRAIKKDKNKLYLDKDATLPELTTERNILVKVFFAGICRTDIAVADGQISVKEGRILGHEFCGRIFGFYDSPLKNLRIGDVVSADPMRFGKEETDFMCGMDCDGSFAEYIAVPDAAIVKMPESLLSPTGAYLEPVAASLAPFRILKCQDSDVVLYGKNRIACLTENIGRILGFGNITTIRNLDDIGENKYDVVIETQPEYICDYVKALKPKGMLILKSRGFKGVNIIPNDVAMKEISICGARYGSFQHAVEILCSDNLDKDRLFGKIYSLEDYEQAFADARIPDSKKIFFRICAE